MLAKTLHVGYLSLIEFQKYTVPPLTSSLPWVADRFLKCNRDLYVTTFFQTAQNLSKITRYTKILLNEEKYTC